ncbi:competence protein ComEC [Ketogulonicigenium robustum]|uniref:Competence protein ComEC n=1 Tax=Ketogulonicigenium robustum TaxID=92947 RepID=A0A1W6P0T3_9RHOB|nr:ComEC/Rec2 family competence protein [Ketogulonicigenium robustum]ARO15054.1 competence protein ComEC [Ketogulonicigenium robustum]
MRGAAFRDALARVIDEQRGSLLPWVPVLLGAGMAIWLALPFEPPVALYAACLLGAGALCVPRGAARMFGVAVLLLALGFALAGVRGHLVAAPVLTRDYYGPVMGRIIDIDANQAGAMRLTLDNVVLDRIAPQDVPAQVRISLAGRQGFFQQTPGTVVMMTARLTPPNGPPEPHGFDFRRYAWFEGLGAVGSTQTPAVTAYPPQDGALLIERVRMILSGAIRAHVAGDAGGFLAAVLTGDRQGLSPEVNQWMRDTSLYHLVSISGVHMALLAAFVFALVRGAVALVPPLALRVSSKKIAAAVALPVAAFYLALAGRDIATERAFITVAVSLGAVLIDRRAISLNTVAIAATLVLLMRPEAVLNAGFQMSFAAVVGLVVLFDALRHTQHRWPGLRRWRAMGWVLLPAAVSLVAGVATAPYAAASFNRISHYSLPANMLAEAAMSFLVMPAGVLALVLWPLGVGPVALWVAAQGTRWILWVAAWIASWPFAVSAVQTPQPAVLPLMTLGGLFVILWRGWGRWLGLPVVAAALVLWGLTARPALLIAGDGAAVAVLGAEGRVFSKPRGAGYAAANWLRSDGEIISQADAAARVGWVVGDGRATIVVAGQRVLHLTTAVAARAAQDCGGADIVVAAHDLPPLGDCTVFDKTVLRASGAVAGIITNAGLRLDTVEATSGRRLWIR